MKGNQRTVRFLPLNLVELALNVLKNYTELNWANHFDLTALVKVLAGFRRV